MKHSKLMIMWACWAALLQGPSAVAQTPGAVTPLAVAAKLIQRGDAPEVVSPEMRIVRRNDILTVQSELRNNGVSDRMVFYRFRWLDAVGNQVGDSEAWKQLTLMGQSQLTLKGVAAHPSAQDFRLELTIEKK